jgi:hypothetical protein
MNCHRIGVAIICRGHSSGKRARCGVGSCGRPHTRLCDFPTRSGRTCDVKLCDLHTSRDGERDFCPFHARQLRLELQP